MFENFDAMCNYYKSCKGCPYENCPTTEDCVEEYNKDKATTVTRLDMLIVN